MANTYDLGDEVRISAPFTQGGVGVDPTTVAIVVRKPDGTESTYTYAGGTVIKDSTGNYYVDVSPDQVGTYRYRGTSTGTGKASDENWFEVRERLVP